MNQTCFISVEIELNHVYQIQDSLSRESLTVKRKLAHSK